jgi:hypothetical protein
MHCLWIISSSSMGGRGSGIGMGIGGVYYSSNVKISRERGKIYWLGIYEFLNSSILLPTF